MQHTALQLYSAARQARRTVELAILLQSIVQKAMTMVIGPFVAGRVIAYAHVVLFLLWYRLIRMLLSFCVWSLSLLNI